MSFGDLDTLIVTGTLKIPDGTNTLVLASGTVTFEFPDELLAILDPGSKLIIVPRIITGQLNNGVLGTFQGTTFTPGVVVPVTDDPDVNPVGWPIKISENVTNANRQKPRVYYSVLNRSLGPTVDLAELIQVANFENIFGYVYASDFNLLKGRVAALEANQPGGGGAVASVNAKTGVVVLTPADIGADAAGAAASAQSASQPASTTLAAIAAEAATLYGVDLLTAADAAALRAKAGVGTAGTQPTSAFDAAGAATTAAGVRVAKAGDTMTGPLALPADPVSALQAATKQYVDAHAAGFTTHAPVRLKSTANVNLASGLANGQTLDGQTIATGDRILLNDQTTNTQNGVYVAPASGAASRATDADSSAELDKGALFVVQQGTVNGGSSWATSGTLPTIGTDPITFGQVSGPTTISAGPAITVAGNQVGVTPGGVTDTEVAAGNKDGASGTPSMRRIGSAAGQVVGGSDARLTDARTPTAHAASHGSGAADALTVAQSQVTGLPAALTALAPKDNPTFTTKITTPHADITGIPGASTPIRLVGGASAKPTTGTFLVGDLVLGMTGGSPAQGTAWLCVTGGTFPGTPPVFIEIGAALTAYALQLAEGYTDFKFNAVPALVISDPTIMSLSPAVNGIMTLDVSPVAALTPIVGRNTADQLIQGTTPNPPGPLGQVGTDLRDVTGLTVALALNTIYEIKLYLFYKASVQAKLRISFTTPSALGWAGQWSIGGLSSTIGAAVSEGPVKRASLGWNAPPANPATVGGAGVGSPLALVAAGIIQNTNVAGNLKLQAAQAFIDNAADVTILKNSVLIATPIG